MRVTGGAGRRSTHERGDGKTGYNDVVGGWRQTPPARYLTDRELSSGERVWGQAPLSGRQPVYLRNKYEWVKLEDFRSRYCHRIGNSNVGMQRARRHGPPRNLRFTRTRGSEAGKRPVRYSAIGRLQEGYGFREVAPLKQPPTLRRHNTVWRCGMAYRCGAMF